ncbi:MAG TPA: HEAT repeat domain-containing protein [Blastocatellia bacterium]|nr:HEAT repeat domain-containing protein [Blastocatellia bacterium]
MKAGAHGLGQSVDCDSKEPYQAHKKALDRARGLELIGKRRRTRDNEALIQGLSDRSPIVRVAAAAQLGNFRMARTASALNAALSDPNYEVRMTAVKSLSGLLTGGRATPEMLRLLKDRNELVRIEASEALVRVGDRRALVPLWAAISDRSPLVRSYVAAAIGQLGRRPDLVALEQQLEREPSDTVRVGILGALLSRGRKNGLGGLLALLESPDYRVRCAAANTLSHISVDNEMLTAAQSALREALLKESTVAGKSSLSSSIRAIRKALTQKAR